MKISLKYLIMALIAISIVFFALEKGSSLPNVHDLSLPNADTNYQANLNELINKIKTSGYNVTNSLPPGYVTDGSVDYTRYVQDAIEKHDSIIFPDFPLLISYHGLIIDSEKQIYFPPGSKIIVEPNNQPGYTILNIRHTEDVALIDPVVVGDRFQHIGTAGEWGLGIGIYSSDNIKIYNPMVSDCWGDGIYIGANIKGVPSKNIYISNAWCYKNRRNGFSIVSVDSLQLVDPYAAYSDGTLPMAGIDIEPNSNDDEIYHVTILNPITVNNKGYGISISLSELLGIAPHTIGITIQGQRDTGSSVGCYVSCLKARRGEPIPAKSNLSGSINIIGPQWVDNQKNIFNAYGFRTNDLQLNIVSPSAIDSNGNKVPLSVLNNIIRRQTDSNGYLILK